VGENDFLINDAWGRESGKRALEQVMELCGGATKLKLVPSLEGDSFATVPERDPKTRGILSLKGSIQDNSTVCVTVEVFRGIKDGRVPLHSLFRLLADLGEGCRLASPTDLAEHETSLSVEICADAQPMSFARSNRFSATLKKLDRLAVELQDALPCSGAQSNLIKVYEQVSEVLEPIVPGSFVLGSRLTQWARETLDFLNGSSCVAIYAPSHIRLNIALTALAECAEEFGTSLGLFVLPAIQPAKLLELVGKAPGTVVLAATKLSMGTNVYEMANEVRSLLASISFSNNRVIFTGTFEQLQEVFHGGQGGACDPLVPVMRRVPDVQESALIRFAVRRAAVKAGGIGSAAEQGLCQDVSDAMKELAPSQRERLLPAVANRVVKVWDSGKSGSLPSTQSYVNGIAELSETPGGLSAKPRVERSPDVQDRYVQALTDEQLLAYFQEHLLAQDQALEQLIDRLRTESLTRPLHQPLRYCAQGTPGTGKSESAVLVARRLGIPFINIDAASMSDHHTASAQLLGSGRGIVGSHQSGRLEQAAKHHTGVLIEVSDLDHAVPSVRSALADLFLQILETGEAQSATGAMFSCAGIILAFTMNLPLGMDEGVRKSLGFNSTPDKAEVSRRVASEIKQMLSSAFLSRVGTPILFDPLDGDAVAGIVERAVGQAVLSAADRLRLGVTDVVVEPGLGKQVIAAMEPHLVSFGARAILEHGRSLAAKALVGMQGKTASSPGRTLRVSLGSDGRMIINRE